MKIRSFDNFLLEKEQSHAQQKAVEMGLKYKGFGYWVDPKTNQITHKTEKGELVPNEKASAELAGDTAGNLRPDAMDTKPGINALPQQQQAPGSGVLKAPEPGTEQYPRGGNWMPGPNGDNCVTDQPPPKDLSYDMFVGKTNFSKWVAGKDGSNYANLDYRKLASSETRSVAEEVIEEEPSPRSAMGQPSPGNQSGLSNGEKLKSQGFRHLGFNTYRRDDGMSAKIIRGEIIYYSANGEVSAEDGGGLSLIGAKPTWKRSIDGQAMTPPAQPETPDEIAAVPDPVPAQPPMGYDKFMNKKTLDQSMDTALQNEIDEKYMEATAVYDTIPALSGLKIRVEQIIDEAGESDDPNEQMFAAFLKDKLVENGANYQKMMTDVDEKKASLVSQALVRMLETEFRMDKAGDDKGLTRSYAKDLKLVEKLTGNK